MKLFDLSAYPLVIVGVCSSSLSFGITLNDVIVTAQKKEQDLQDVPISAYILDLSGKASSSEKLNKKDDHILNLHISPSVIAPNFFIRGIGSTAGVGFEQSVATFVDDVFFGRGNQTLIPIFDEKRIEILRGPQPTYFGQNAIAGAINIETLKPTWETTGYLFLSLGSDEESTQAFAYSAPVNNQLAVRVAGYSSLLGGYLDNSITGDSQPEQNDKAIKFSAIWQPSEKSSVYFKTQFANVDHEGFIIEPVGCNELLNTPCGQALNNPNLNVEYDLNGQNAPGGNVSPNDTLSLNGVELPIQDMSNVTTIFERQDRTVESDSHSLKLHHDFNTVTFQSISAYSNYQSDFWTDADATPFPLLQFNLAEDYRQFSQEFRLAPSKIHPNYDWILGFYAQRSELASNNILLGAFEADVPIFGEGQGTNHAEEDTWISGYASFTYFLSDTFSTTLGGRYTRVNKEADIQNISADINPNENRLPDYVVASESLSGTFEDSNFNPSIEFQWYPQDNSMYYAKYSEAFKSGGFNVGFSTPDSAESYTFNSETAQSFEAGFKGTFWNEALALNIALFTTLYNDLQVSSLDLSTNIFSVNNAASAISSGLEFEMSYQLMPEWQIGVASSVLSAEYDEFLDAPCNSSEINGGLCGVNGTINRNGETLLYAPDWQFSLFNRYQHRLTNSLNIALILNTTYKDEYFVSDIYEPEGIQEGHEIVDVKVSLFPTKPSWTLAFYGNNITDQRVIEDFGPALLEPQSSLAASGRGAHYGVEARLEF